MPKSFDATSSKVINAVAPYLTERIPTATANNLADIGKYILDNKALANQFLNVLVNRIVRVIITSRMYENPLAVFKRGSERYGDLIEEIYVNIANAHEFDPQIAENEVYKRVIPDVGAVYHQMNSQLYYKTTISEDQLAKAFTSEQGMRTLIAGIVDSLYSGANYDEFLQMKNLFAESTHEFYRIYTDEPSTSTAKNIVTNFKSASNLLEFMSTNYNPVGVKNFTPKRNQVLFLRADIDAIIDVNVLAAAFNMDKAEFMGRKILVDDFGVNNDDIYAVLCDEEFLIVHNNLDKFTEIYNAQGLYWNYFWHVWRTYSRSPFSNMIAFCTGSATAGTAVTITNSTSATYAKGSNVQMTATVTPDTATNQNVTWSLRGANADTYISSTGMVHLGEHQTGTLEIVATLASNPVIKDVYTWTPSTGAFAQKTYSVTVTAGSHGSASASPTSGANGTEVTLTITPASGYVLDKVTGVTLDENNKFIIRDQDYTINVTFKSA